MNAPFSTERRPVCPRCAMPQASCLCARAVPLQHVTRVLILQHPAEAGHAKGTAQLLRLSLQHERLEVGEVFDEAALRDWIGDAATLLYPLDAPHPEPQRSLRRAPDCLVVIDGTWRQSRRMLQANPLLQALPRLSLTGTPSSRYAVRKAHRPGQLSTIEAAVLGLRELEGPHASQAALLDSFDAHMAELAVRWRRPREDSAGVTSGPVQR